MHRPRPISATVKNGAGAICTTVTAGAGIATSRVIAAITMMMTTTMTTIDQDPADRIVARRAGLPGHLEGTAARQRA